MSQNNDEFIVNPPRTGDVRQRRRAAPGSPKTNSQSEADTAAPNILPSSRVGSSCSTKKNNKDDEKAAALEAFKSVRLCYRAAFLSFGVSLLTLVLEGGIIDYQKPSGLKQITGDQLLLMLVPLYRLGFGAGLRSVSLIYETIENQRQQQLQPNYANIIKVTLTTARLWRHASWLLVFSAGVLLSVSLPKELVASDCYLRSAIASGSILLLAIVGSMVLRVASAATVRQAATEHAFVAKKKDDAGTVTGTGAQSEDANKARSCGLVAARNMSFAWGAFLLLGLTQVVAVWNKPRVWHATGFLEVGRALFGNYSACSEVLESFAMAALIQRLHDPFVKAVVKATDGRDDGQDLLELYTAQRGFYSKVGDTMHTESVMKLLPYLLSVAKRVLKGVIDEW
jgi:hypothetical protein